MRIRHPSERNAAGEFYLAKYDPSSGSAAEMSQTLSLFLSTIRKLAPPGSVYSNTVGDYEPHLSSGVIAISMALEPVRGMLQALRNEYEAGYLESVVELIHADIFADFLDMADYLLQQGYKDPAAVVTGSVLEEHLRKLCIKHGIPVVRADGSPKNADALNTDLTAAGIYSKLDQKNVTAWQGFRNKAAHGEYNEYTNDQIAVMLLGVREFVSRIPA